MTGESDAFAALDRVIAERRREIWVGAEPTYTAADSEAAQWLHEALGEDKMRRAARMCATLAARAAGAAMLRSVGRPYAAEPCPRWCFGVLARRDGTPVWHGPPDPLLAGAAEGVPRAALARVEGALCDALRERGWPPAVLAVPGELPLRIAFRLDGAAPPGGIGEEPSLARESVHVEAGDGAEIVDALAARGTYLIAAGIAPDAVVARETLRIELPAMPDVVSWLELLELLARALAEAGAPHAVLAGFPPPVDETVSWTTLTPDPAVVEVNMAPQPDLVGFRDALGAIDAAARAEGLASQRLHYNGLETDSGGGGQITLGGPRALASPFLSEPTLLPSLVRYLNRHPSLSYWWSPESAGPASQGPRADEGLSTQFRELALALALLDARPAASPLELQRALAPFLVDASGNTHRSEINVEKLWNDALGARGRQGLVEFRALRMSRDPEHLCAVAALLRALVAMLADAPVRASLVHWGDRLHDRFSLPFYLRADLREVLADLREAGLGLGARIERQLLDDDFRHIADVALPGARVCLRRAVEHWSLIGDVASQERGGARLVDASTARVELCLRGEAGALAAWRACALGVDLPLRAERDEDGDARVCGVRYRCFAPDDGLHPVLGTQSPLRVTFSHPVHGHHELALHDWRPGGGAYAGLPADPRDAAARRRERVVLTPTQAPVRVSRPAPRAACGEHVLDLRWMWGGPLETLGP